MTAAEILGVPLRQARSFFPGDKEEISARFRALATEWHPDHCSDPDASTVFSHLSELRRAAEDAALAAAEGQEFSMIGGARVRVKSIASSSFEAGTVMVCARSVAYLVGVDFADLASAANGYRPAFSSDRMKAEMERFLPRPKAGLKLEDGGFILGYERTADQILLSDLLTHYGPIQATHVAWIISSLENIACWFAYSGLVHGAISPEMLLISPEYHSVAVTGPMLYLTEVGKRPAALPARTLEAMPRLQRSGEVATSRTDLELIRLTARQCLGDPAGASLAGNPDVPKALTDWLMMPPAKDAMADYAAWERVRERAFGERKFSEFRVSPAQVYPG